MFTLAVVGCSTNDDSSNKGTRDEFPDSALQACRVKALGEIFLKEQKYRADFPPTTYKNVVVASPQVIEENTKSFNSCQPSDLKCLIKSTTDMIWADYRAMGGQENRVKCEHAKSESLCLLILGNEILTVALGFANSSLDKNKCEFGSSSSQLNCHINKRASLVGAYGGRILDLGLEDQEKEKGINSYRKIRNNETDLRFKTTYENELNAYQYCTSAVGGK